MDGRTCKRKVLSMSVTGSPYAKRKVEKSICDSRLRIWSKERKLRNYLMRRQLKKLQSLTTTDMLFGMFLDDWWELHKKLNQSLTRRLWSMQSMVKSFAQGQN